MRNVFRTGRLLFTFALLTSLGYSQDSKEKVRLRIPAVGRIFLQSGEEIKPAGSGVVVSKEGKVLSNYHQLTSSSGKIHPQIRIVLPQENDPFGRLDTRNILELQVTRFLQVYDLALLQIQGVQKNFPFIPLADDTRTQILDTVYVIGYPEIGGESITVSSGIISGRDTQEQWLKLDAPLLHGYSGGAVVNERGELVGIPTQKRVDFRIVNLREDGRSEPVTFGTLDFVRPASLVQLLLTSSAVRIELGGEVRDEKAPVPNALVALIRGNEEVVNERNLIAYTLSDDLGRFRMHAHTERGKHKLRVKAGGYQVLDYTLELAGNVQGLVLRLKHAR